MDVTERILLINLPKPPKGFSLRTIAFFEGNDEVDFEISSLRTYVKYYK